MLDVIGVPQKSYLVNPPISYLGCSDWGPNMVQNHDFDPRFDDFQDFTQDP